LGVVGLRRVGVGLQGWFGVRVGVGVRIGLGWVRLGLGFGVGV
jgi:hypothetical protein